LKSTKGFTLIEVILVIALISIVTAAAFSVFAFGQKAFKVSERQYNVQNEVRLAIGVVSKQIKYATQMSVMTLATCEAKMTAKEKYHYLYIKDGQLYDARYQSATNTYLVKTLARNISNSAVFNKISQNSLRIVLTALEGTQDFETDTIVVLDNFKLLSPEGTLQGLSAGAAIEYSLDSTVVSGPAPVKVTGINITGAHAITSDKATLTLVVSVTPSTASNKAVTWSVNRSDLASISQSGVLQAIANGTVIVTAEATDGSGVSGTKNIVISNQTTVLVPVQTITVSSNNGTKISTVGGSLNLSASVLPENASNDAVTWSVNNGAVASIDQTGKLVALNNGTVTAIATAKDGSGVTGQLLITVEGQIAPIVSSIIINGQTNVSIPSAPTQSISLDYTATVLDQAGNEMPGKTIAWSLSSYSEVSISSSTGELTVGRKANGGTAIITAKVNGTSITSTLNITLKK
jgi:prepilin-type N-terminal cleavage/methylation domain-containing protein